MCMQSWHRQQAPLMIFVSIFCNRGMNHALWGVHSLAASPGESALSAGGAKHCKTGAVVASGCEWSLCHLGSGTWVVGVGPGPLAWAAVPSLCVLWAHGEGWRPLASGG